MPTKYAVISQAMKGIDPSRVKLQREKAEAAVRAAGYEPIDTIYEEDSDYGVSVDDVVNPALWHMGLALARLSKAHAITCATAGELYAGAAWSTRRRLLSASMSCTRSTNRCR